MLVSLLSVAENQTKVNTVILIIRLLVARYEWNTIAALGGPWVQGRSSLTQNILERHIQKVSNVIAEPHGSSGRADLRLNE